MTMMTELQVPVLEVEVGLSVRPDVLWIPIAAKVEDIAPSRAVATLRNATQILQGRLALLHPQARLVPGRLDLRGSSGNKSGRSAESDVQLSGVAILELEEGRDYWARAELAARAVEVLREVARGLAKGKPPVTLGWRAPVGRVSDVEPHRATLTARHNAQLRALGDETGRVTIGDWELPIEVAQTPVSLDEVRIALVPRPRPPRG